MSSTSRGGQRSVADNYATPAFCVSRLLDAVELPGGAWLEPAAGNGAIIRAVHSHPRAPGALSVSWSAVEIRPECRSELGQLVQPDDLKITNFLTDWEPDRRFRVAITNPPFRLAEEFLHRMMRVADLTVLLLRLNFLGSAKRAAFLRQHAPDVYVLPQRPAFASPDALGKRRWQTDSCEYAWFVFGPERRFGSVRVLSLTKEKERR